LENILTGTIEETGASAGMIFVKDRVTECLEWGVSIGLSGGFVESYRTRSILPGEGLSGRIAQSGEPIFIANDSSHDPRIARSVIQQENLNTFLGVPIYADDEIVAVMNILTHPPNILSDQEASLVKAIGNHVGFAIQNARLFTERKLVEEALRESEEKFRSVIEQSNDAIYILFNDKFDLINRRFTELTGITVEDSEAPDFNFRDYAGPKDRILSEERQRMWIRGDQPSNVYEFTLIHKDGSLCQAQASVTEIIYRDGTAILGIIRDISDQKALEDQLRQAQKVESIGHLAGGIAHDFNNLLTPILGNIGLIQMDMSMDDPNYNIINEVKDAAKRAAGLTRQLLAFSRKQIMEFKVVNLNDIISDFMKILRRTIREDVHISLNLELSIGLVEADRTQIDQVLLNLCVNAQDAMPNGGTITIETASVQFDEEYVRMHAGASAGSYVMLSVADTGTGIDKKTVDKIFDPFFTTKGVGKGTGMGLATVYGVVKQHGGTVRVYSEPGQGTIFKVYLPESEKEEDHHSDDKTVESISGSETVLVVEDDSSVRRLVVLTLQRYGYKVIEATGPEEAQKKTEQMEPAIDILLTDVIMPDMNGRELYEILIKTRPQLKVLYMSGYAQSIIALHGVLDEEINFLQKPFMNEALAHKVRKVLDN